MLVTYMSKALDPTISYVHRKAVPCSERKFQLTEQRCYISNKKNTYQKQCIYIYKRKEDVTYSLT